MHKILSSTIVSVLLVSIGLGAGYFSARQGAEKPKDDKKSSGHGGDYDMY